MLFSKYFAPLIFLVKKLDTLFTRTCLLLLKIVFSVGLIFSITEAGMPKQASSRLLIQQGTINNPIQMPDLGLPDNPADKSYYLGMLACNKKRYSSALRHFLDCYTHSPVSDVAFKAMVMESYCLYCQGKYVAAISSADDVLLMRLDKSQDAVFTYVSYLKALSAIQSYISDAYSVQTILDAQTYCQDFLKQYPDEKKYCAHIEQVCLPFVKNALLAKDMYVGRHYLRNKYPAGAIARFIEVLNSQDKNMFQPEALFRLLESYTALGLYDVLDDRFKQYASMVEYQGEDDAYWLNKTKFLLQKYAHRASCSS